MGEIYPEDEKSKQKNIIIDSKSGYSGAGKNIKRKDKTQRWFQ